MGDRGRRSQPHQFSPAAPHYRHQGGAKNHLPRKGRTAVKLLVIAALLSVGGSLLSLAGIILAGTLVGLALATPVFLICSPVLVPAAVLVAGAVTGFLTSGAFGLTGLSWFLWLLNSFRQATGRQPLEYARQKVPDGIVQVGDKTKHTGETKRSRFSNSYILLLWFLLFNNYISLFWFLLFVTSISIGTFEFDNVL